MREKQQNLSLAEEKSKTARRRKTPATAEVAPPELAPVKRKTAAKPKAVSEKGPGAGKVEMSATKSIEASKGTRTRTSSKASAPAVEAPAKAVKPATTRAPRKASEPVAAAVVTAEPPPVRRTRPAPETAAPVAEPRASAPAPAPQPVAPAPVTVAAPPAPASHSPSQGHTDAPRHERSQDGGGHHGGEQRQGHFQRRQGRFRRFSRDRRFSDRQQEGRSEQHQPDERVYTEDTVAPTEPGRPYEPQFEEGIVEVSGKGFGFLRDPKRNFVQTPQDVFVTPEVVRRHMLRDGQWIKGEVRRGSRGLQLFKLTEINGEDPEKFKNLPMFEELTTINPNKRIKLETDPDRYTTRVMDLMTPIGKGQRGLIVAPPRTGKTTLLQHIGEAVVRNYPSMKLIILLVDERPEEVTEIRRAVPDAEIMASSNDNDVKSHTRIAQLAIERAKRLVEAGQDVFVLLDSITRMGRAFNNSMSNTGRTLSGGLDARAMEVPRRLFAAARNTEEAGSLTILGTALIETGSKMDELIFQEFKGTGNMDLVLDRKISDQRIYPAVDIFQSGTRREELLVPAEELEKTNVIRRGLAGHKPVEAIDRLLMFLRRFPTNIEMLRGIPSER